MNRTIRFIVLVAAVVCLTAVFATSAFAYEGYWIRCSNCHASAPTAITPVVTDGAVTGDLQAYTVSAPGATEWAVFAGATRIAQGTGATAEFSLPVGTTYNFFAVAGTPTAGGYGTVSISPAYSWPAAPGDVTPPVSTSDAVASYTNFATIRIDATDEVGGSGVQRIYYRVGTTGSLRVTPTGVGGWAEAYVKPTSTGTFTYELFYWAEDREGNIEAENSVTFTVTADGWVSTAVPSTVSGPNGMSPWTYQDAYDTSAKREGGYAPYGGVSGFYSNPHGGYDTSTNKCKVCHAVHRAEGTYYLLRANSVDDACDYCHIGGSAHSNKIVYTENDAGKFTPNGHTMGAPSSIPDSSVRMETVSVELIDGETSTSVKVRQYDETKKQLYRTQFYGRSPAGHPAIGSGTLQYALTGPTPLSCSNCHQVHNAVTQIWQPAGFVAGGRNNSDWAQRQTQGYKLLRRFPGATAGDANTTYTGGMFASTTAFAKVPESTIVADFNYSTSVSKENSYTDAQAGLTGYLDENLPWRQPDWVIGTNLRGVEATAGGNTAYEAAGVNQYALSVWCADCHNLNIGTNITTGDSELGFFKAHAERTHPVPASRSLQCYGCHRNDIGGGSDASVGSDAGLDDIGCDRCHYNPGRYALQRAGADFPHSGGDDSIKLLGAFSLASAPQPDGTFDFDYVQVDITADNLDAVCLRCHTDQGVHQ